MPTDMIEETLANLWKLIDEKELRTGKYQKQLRAEAKALEMELDYAEQN